MLILFNGYYSQMKAGDMLGIFGVEVACEWARVLDDSNVGSLVLGEDLLQHGEGAVGIESDATPFTR